MIRDFIQEKINEIFEVSIGYNKIENYEIFINAKKKYSRNFIASKFKLNEFMFADFEEALRQFFTNRDDRVKSRLSCFRVGLWLETICKNLDLSFSLNESISNEELAIKQVRALELMIRDIVNEKMGGRENVLLKLRDLFKQDIVEKWLKCADETGVLSGTTFSELSSIFLDKDVFKSVEDIFENSDLKLSRTGRESLRYILEDIRLIRNAVAHNKRISNVQIEALNAYYLTIAQMIKDSNTININPDRYLDLDKANMESFLTGLKEDGRAISINIDELKSSVEDVRTQVSAVGKRSLVIVGGVLLILISTGAILHLVSKQSGASAEIINGIKDVKEIVTGDSELRNMASTDDLTAVKELNSRTKDRNAKRIAILYFDNSSGDASLDKLRKGLADMMITDLSNIRMLDIVERDNLESILKEQKMSNSREFDPKTAAKIGKLMGAQVILTGSYFDMLGSLRIDARFIDVETGRILKSDGVDGQTSSFFKIQKQLSWKIIQNMDTKISEDEKKELASTEKIKPLSLDDLKEFSNALDLYDLGKKDESKKIAEEMRMKHPDFTPVDNLLKKL